MWINRKVENYFRSRYFYRTTQKEFDATGIIQGVPKKSVQNARTNLPNLKAAQAQLF